MQPLFSRQLGVHHLLNIGSVKFFRDCDIPVFRGCFVGSLHQDVMEVYMRIQPMLFSRAKRLMDLARMISTLPASQSVRNRLNSLLFFVTVAA